MTACIFAHPLVAQQHFFFFLVFLYSLFLISKPPLLLSSSSMSIPLTFIMPRVLVFNLRYYLLAAFEATIPTQEQDISYAIDRFTYFQSDT